MYCNNKCITSYICDHDDPSYFWQLTANTDGSYHILHKLENKYVTIYTLNQLGKLGLGTSPTKFEIVQSNSNDKLFYIRAWDNKKNCLKASGFLENCEENLLRELFFFDNTVNQQTFIPNTSYLISWLGSDLNADKKCWGSLGQFNCSPQSPSQAFKFVPNADGTTYSIIDGLGQAWTLPPTDYSKVTQRNPMWMAKSNPSDPFQQFRVLRSPQFPERIIIKNPSTNKCAVRGLSGWTCGSPGPEDDPEFHFVLDMPCEDEVVKQNTWYLIRFESRTCINIEPDTNRLGGGRCQSSDSYLFKFVWDLNSRSYRIYNKSQGDLVLTVATNPYNGSVIGEKPLFAPLKEGWTAQMWNTTVRTKYLSLGFLIWNRLSNTCIWPSYNGAMGGCAYNVPLWAESSDLQEVNSGMLTSVVDNTTEYLGVIRKKLSFCPKKILYSIN
jgi:hypothetical protein